MKSYVLFLARPLMKALLLCLGVYFFTATPCMLPPATLEKAVKAPKRGDIPPFSLSEGEGSIPPLSMSDDEITFFDDDEWSMLKDIEIEFNVQ